VSEANTPKSTPSSVTPAGSMPAAGTDAAAATATGASAPGGDQTRKPRVAVLFGGRSSEHAVSCVTAAGVLAAIDRTRYDVVPIGIAKSGQWVLAGGDPSNWSLSSGRLPEVEGAERTVSLAEIGGSHQLMVTAPNEVPMELGAVDVVFPLLHGPFGEDGTIQGLLELSDTRYVGAGVLASAVGMDKHYMKVIFADAGLDVGPYIAVTDRQWTNDPQAVRDSVAALGFPVFVKPARAGSSMGISKVDFLDQLDAAVEQARQHDLKLVIEAGITGREIECAVLEGRNGSGPRTSMPGEVVVTDHGHAFYDFTAKYVQDNAASLSCPADIPADAAERVRELAAMAFEAVGAEGLSRVDFFYTPAGELIINEINTMPGFTPKSMYPQMWAASGLDYPELIDELLQLALNRKTGLR
jgi:D-alanine-D-alanine ligase